MKRSALTQSSRYLRSSWSEARRWLRGRANSWSTTTQTSFRAFGSKIASRLLRLRERSVHLRLMSHLVTRSTPVKAMSDGRLESLLAAVTNQLCAYMQMHSGQPVSANMRAGIRSKVSTALRCARLIGKLHPDSSSAPGGYSGWEGPFEQEDTKPGLGPVLMSSWVEKKKPR